MTADELPDGTKNLEIFCRLNGKTVQSSNTDMMIFLVVETLIYITEGLTLEPGDIILMGGRRHVLAMSEHRNYGCVIVIWLRSRLKILACCETSSQMRSHCDEGHKIKK